MSDNINHENNHGEPRPLRQGVQEHLQTFQLAPEQLQNLMQMQKDAEIIEEPQIVSKKNLYYLPFASAAVFLLAILVALQANIFTQQAADLPNEIAMEVAKNHIKLKPLEVKANSLVPISNYFTELDFSPLKSQFYSRRGTTLLGARYCSIKGVSAAQIRYQDQHGKLQTLYEVGYDADIYGPIPNFDKGEQPLVITIKGITVEIWQEHGLLMASVMNNL